MAEGKIPEPLNVKRIDIGDSHIYVYKYGNIVFMFFSILIESGESSKGWKQLATLPSDLRPVVSFYFMIPDANADRDGLQAQIISSNGNLQVYLPETGRYRASGAVTYFI